MCLLAQQDKMYIVNKLFDNETIRTVCCKEEERYYISAVDVVGALLGRARPRKCWSDLKAKLIKEAS